jgi:precorrin-3B methylase
MGQLRVCRRNIVLPIAWGTGASAEVNVHVSISEDTTPWNVVSNRIKLNGIVDIVSAVNRKQMREIYIPEI